MLLQSSAAQGCSSLTSVTALDFAFLSVHLNETAMKAMLDGEGLFCIPNPSFPSNKIAAMQRNSRGTATNTKKHLIHVRV